MFFPQKHSNEENKEEEYEYECSECGAKVSKDDKICPNCGEDISEIDQECEVESPVEGIPDCKDAKGSFTIENNEVHFVKSDTKPTSVFTSVFYIGPKSNGENDLVIKKEKLYSLTNKDIIKISRVDREKIKEKHKKLKSLFDHSLEKCKDKNQYTLRIHNPVEVIKYNECELGSRSVLRMKYNHDDIFNIDISEIEYLRTTNKKVKKIGVIVNYEDGSKNLLSEWDYVEVIPFEYIGVIRKILKAESGKNAFKVHFPYGAPMTVAVNDVKESSKRFFSAEKRLWETQMTLLELRIDFLKQLASKRGDSTVQKMPKQEPVKNKWTKADKATFTAGAALMGLGLFKFGEKIVKDITKGERKRQKEMRDYLEKGKTYIPFTGFGDDDE